MTTTQTARTPATKADGNPEPDDLARQIAQIRQEVGVLTEMFADLAKSQGAQLRDKAGEFADRTRGAGRQMLREAKSHADALEGELERHLRERPLTCIAVAAGLGYVAGMLSRR